MKRTGVKFCLCTGFVRDKETKEIQAYKLRIVKSGRQRNIEIAVEEAKKQMKNNRLYIKNLYLIPNNKIVYSENIAEAIYNYHGIGYTVINKLESKAKAKGSKAHEPKYGRFNPRLSMDNKLIFKEYTLGTFDYERVVNNYETELELIHLYPVMYDYIIKRVDEAIKEYSIPGLKIERTNTLGIDGQNGITLNIMVIFTYDKLDSGSGIGLPVYNFNNTCKSISLEQFKTNVDNICNSIKALTSHSHTAEEALDKLRFGTGTFPDKESGEFFIKTIRKIYHITDEQMTGALDLLQQRIDAIRSDKNALTDLIKRIINQELRMGLFFLDTMNQAEMIDFVLKDITDEMLSLALIKYALTGKIEINLERYKLLKNSYCNRLDAKIDKEVIQNAILQIKGGN